MQPVPNGTLPMAVRAHGVLSIIRCALGDCLRFHKGRCRTIAVRVDPT